jgi:hypothetical protein
MFWWNGFSGYGVDLVGKIAKVVFGAPGHVYKEMNMVWYASEVVG